MNTERKIIRKILRLIIVIIAWIAAVYTLNKFEYLSELNNIDNVFGMLPVIMAIMFAGGLTKTLLTKRKNRFTSPSIGIMLLSALSFVLFPTALKGNWRVNVKSANGTEAAPDLSVFIPFSKASKTAKLDEKPALLFVENLPLLDGATALYPVYAAIAEAVYDENAFSHNDVICTNTAGAYKAIISGQRDIIFTATASRKQIAAAKLAGVELHFTPVGREAFVFLTGKDNPIENISWQQIRNIYSGKTAYWKTLGWEKGGKIIAFQRPEGSGSQTGLQAIMNKIPVQVPQPLPDASLVGTNSLMRQVSVEWRGVQPAIGYSYRYFAVKMYPNANAKLLQVNGIEPSVANIQNGTYPFCGDFYAVTNGKPEGNAKHLIDWILSPEGQKLIEKTGYIPKNQAVF